MLHLNKSMGLGQFAGVIQTPDSSIPCMKIIDEKTSYLIAFEIIDPITYEVLNPHKNDYIKLIDLARKHNSYLLSLTVRFENKSGHSQIFRSEKYTMRIDAFYVVEDRGEIRFIHETEINKKKSS